MNNYIIISIAIGVLCILAIAGYFAYRKYTSQQETINQLVQRYNVIDNILLKPMYEQNYRQDIHRETEELLHQRNVPPCSTCILEPINVERVDEPAPQPNEIEPEPVEN